MITARGYIEVWRDGVKLSQHVLEREAIGSAQEYGPGAYEFHYPIVDYVVGGVAPEVDDPPPVEPDEPEPDEPPAQPDGKVLFGPWTHDNEPVGPVPISRGPWSTRNNDPNEIKDGTGWWIADERPMVRGHAKYLKTACNKNAGPRIHQRCERSLSTNLRYPWTQEIIPVGRDQWKAPHKQWWGWLMRLDRADSGVDGPRGFYQQFHSPYTVGNSSSPMWGIRGRQGGLAVYRKERENNAPRGPNYTNHYSDIILPWPQGKGETHAYVIEYLPDSRDEGNEGIFRVYLDEDLVFEYDGKRNVTYGYSETRDRPYTPEFRHGLYVVGGHGGYFEQSYSHAVVMGPEATHAQMLEALQYGDIIR